MSSPATSTLLDIQTKVRRLTGSPSPTQLSDQTITNYINTFYLYDFPEHLQTLTLKTTYEFYTTPLVDAYAFPREQYRDIAAPIFIAGSQCFYSQSREQFYIVFPQVEFMQTVATGNGTTGPYNFTLTNTPVLRGYTYQTNVEILNPPVGGPGGATNLASRVLISAISATGAAIVAKDDGQGAFVDQNNAPLVGGINYQTGVCSVVFNPAAVVPAGTAITAQYISTTPSRPTGVLFFGDNFFLRPIPDNVYHVQMDAYMFPSQVLASSDEPAQREWWQYLAYGAALKILTDRLDTDGVQRILPFFQEQQRLILRREIVQNTNERTATIYSEQVNYPYGNGFYRF